MHKILIFLISLLIPSSKPCISIVTQWHSDTAIQCLQSLPALEPKIKFANFFLRSKQISDFLTLTTDLKPFLPHLDYLLGQKQPAESAGKPTTYLVLLQNDREMRANGGFFGSYAKIIIPRTPRRILVEGGASTLEGEGNTGPKIFSPEISFQDIYVPDGALVGHVDPPAPIQTAFKQGWFRLRDSDWEPDFPTAAKTIRWFFEKGDEINPDFLITLNLSTIEKIMKIVGEVDVPEFNFKLNSDNLYTLLQNQAEINFFPGSTQKQNVLTAAGSALTQKISSLKLDQFLQIGQILLDQLNHTNLLVNSTNPDIQKILEEKHWAGQITLPPCGDATAITKDTPPYEGGDQEGVSCVNDTILLVETNLGANKANCCIERKTIHTINFSPYEGETQRGYITHLINLTFTNTSPLENPLPPRFYGGNYISYLRYYLPENTRNIRLTAQPTLPKTLSQYPAPFDGLTSKDWKFSIVNFPLSIFKEIGFFHTTAAGTKSAVQLSYDLPLEVPPGTVSFSSDGGAPTGDDSSEVKRQYQLTLLKQNGLESSPAEINLFGQTHSTNLTSNFSVNTPL